MIERSAASDRFFHFTFEGYSAKNLSFQTIVNKGQAATLQDAPSGNRTNCCCDPK